MSYNMRRSYNPPLQASIGQRRQGGSFYGGQLANNRQNSPHPYQNQGPTFRMQQNPINNQSFQNYSSPLPISKQDPVVPPAAPAKPAPVPQASESISTSSSSTPEEEGVSNISTEETKKKFWFKGKISRAEKVRRRNARLSKLLQPKNAVMILNELVKGCQYLMEEAAGKADINCQFRATVQFDGNEFIGAGRTKNTAKNVAAEIALKYLIKNKQFRVKKEENGDEKMEIQEDGNQVMPWSHIASFAMYKLFTSWGEDPALAAKTPDLAASTPARTPAVMPVRNEPKPARKMPDNPEKLNPLMLMNQMLPNAEWEDLGKTGTPPNVIFMFKVTVDGQIFSGSGPNKKSAKKFAAFAACHKILNINYPIDLYVPMV